MSLKEYGKKRRWNARNRPKTTTEPKPTTGDKDKESHLIFVVHKHAATRLHYDLRLELRGVLKSFAIPKGPSLDPAQKRLAVMVEDHPFEYKDFEGVIPEGNYGAGSMIIWDTGFYSSILSAGKKESETALSEGLKKGDMKFILAGEKLKGEFALVRTREVNSWLLLKKKDKYSTTSDVLDDGRSVVSGRTISELAAKPEAKGSGVLEAPRKPMPHNVKPMLPSPAGKPFDDEGWVFEVKWDGYRAIAEISKKGVSIYSRNKMPLGGKFPAIVESLKGLKFEAVLDGEIVYVGRNGKPDFQSLHDYRGKGSGKSGGRLIYYVFDILHYEGRDLTGLELQERKKILGNLLQSEGDVRISEHVTGDGVAFFGAARKKGLEGIVAKYAKSRYAPGTRSRQWLKIKTRSAQDCVVAGFTKPRESRKYLGSLVLGAYEDGRLVYVGHSGGAFGGLGVKKVYEALAPLASENCPFKTEPPGSDGVAWVKPVLVCEVAFAGWTKDNVMRQPVFVRFREDKTPTEAIVERLMPGTPGVSEETEE